MLGVSCCLCSEVLQSSFCLGTLVREVFSLLFEVIELLGSPFCFGNVFSKFRSLFREGFFAFELVRSFFGEAACCGEVLVEFRLRSIQ